MVVKKYEEKRISKRMWRVIIVLVLIGLVVGHTFHMSRNVLGVPMEVKEWAGSYTAHMVVYR